ncbi:hypothetical protein [[Mycoplasma] testudinis]|uniref:hypothetical protein n=1 Tax=[Mycoplasma] testudinis TaxID=33924 RepID=UPI000486B21E|nr:hypothetical protein [[Mycoplasma] testudinis]
MAQKLTVFSEKVIKEYLQEGLRTVPGISGTVTDKDITIVKNVITINVACLPNVRVYEVCLMAQRTLYYALYRQSDGKQYTINLVIKAFSEGK